MDDTTRKSKKLGKNSSYEVGYGRPPVETRFRENKSGNPSGRPKRSKTRNIRPDLQEVYLQEFPVGEGRSKRKVSAITLLHEIMLRKAMKGDTKAAALVARFAGELGVLHYKDPVEIDFAMLDAEERAIMNKSWQILNKLRAHSKES